MANDVVISRGIKLSYGSEGSFTELKDLMEIPELGGDVDAIEITTLADSAHMFTDGLKSYGDSLAFKFLYKQEQFSTLNSLTGSHTWKVELPDGASCSFGGSCSVKLDGAGVGAALTYTLSVKPNSEMIWA